jgi:uracil phosphoribosyltransferase
MMSSPLVSTVEHPLIARSLTILRDATTDSATFRSHLRLIARLMTAAATQNAPTRGIKVTTPLEETDGYELTHPIVVAPILRAGLGMAEGVLEMIPDAQVAHLGLFRDEETLEPKVYYQSFPNDFTNREILLIDPMLATGGSSIAAASLLKEQGAKSIRFLNLVSCPPGIEAFHKIHPDIPIITASIDARLNEQAYIVPGLGDAGDRYFGTV